MKVTVRRFGKNSKRVEPGSARNKSCFVLNLGSSQPLAVREELFILLTIFVLFFVSKKV